MFIRKKRRKLLKQAREGFADRYSLDFQLVRCERVPGKGPRQVVVASLGSQPEDQQTGGGAILDRERFYLELERRLDVVGFARTTENMRAVTAHIPRPTEDESIRARNERAAQLATLERHYAVFAGNNLFRRSAA